MPAGSALHPVPWMTGGYLLPDERTIRRILLLMAPLAILFLLDIVTTQVILWMGGIELNPFMAGIVAILPLHLAVKALLLLLILGVSLVAEQRVQGSGTIFCAVLIALYGSVVLNNLLVLLPPV